ncbi:ABC transporter ATP-binding protein [Varibaculum massiliense]|uniref:ABC transporter ATP-binding protein n=1 Tax=Varibaculum massiliense TaxID=1852372 RepID=UPI0008DAE495|nr:ABC transporter ATP-binding protein [Varibaculum massiliense]
MLEAREVHFSYRAGVPILAGVDVEVTSGSFLAILGVNGCGKSTLLSCLTGAARPSSGQVFLDGVPLGQVHRLERARKVAYVAQHSHANRLTVYDSVLLGRRPYMQGAPSQEDHHIVLDMLERLGLARYELRYTDELSGGEYQKMVLARAFVQQAETLLLDEPTNNLDLANQQEVMREVRAEVERRGIAAAAVMHDINLSLRYCDSFLFLKAGTVDAVGGMEVVTAEQVKRVYGMDCEIIEHRGRRLVVPS